MAKTIRRRMSRIQYACIGGLLVYFLTFLTDIFRNTSFQITPSHGTRPDAASTISLNKTEQNEFDARTAFEQPRNTRQTYPTTPVQNRKQLAPHSNFGLCHGLVNSTDTQNIPHEIRYGTQILVETQYQNDFWGNVNFPPVPPFQINTHDPHAQDVYISGSIHQVRRPWDPFIWNLFVRVLNESRHHGNSDVPLVVDVGANLGYFSLLAASMGFKVISFEPMNRNVAKFLSSVARNHLENKITIYQNAVTYNSGGFVTMTETHDSNQGNGQIRAYSLSKNGVYGQEFVDTITIDDVINTNVLLMKIDVEGFESAVLNGAKRLICWNVVTYITIEFSHETRQSTDCPAQEMLQLLESVGYEISDVVPDAPPLMSANFAKFPPNILFRLLNLSTAPAYRLGPKSVCS